MLILLRGCVRNTYPRQMFMYYLIQFHFNFEENIKHSQELVRSSWCLVLFCWGVHEWAWWGSI
jgi:hypothetical protein